MKMPDIPAGGDVPARIILFVRCMNIPLQPSPYGPVLGNKHVRHDASKIVRLDGIVAVGNGDAALACSDVAIRDPLMVFEMLGESATLDDIQVLDRRASIVIDGRYFLEPGNVAGRHGGAGGIRKQA